MENKDKFSPKTDQSLGEVWDSSNLPPPHLYPPPPPLPIPCSVLLAHIFQEM